MRDNGEQHRGSGRQDHSHCDWRSTRRFRQTYFKCVEDRGRNSECSTISNTDFDARSLLKYNLMK